MSTIEDAATTSGPSGRTAEKYVYFFGDGSAEGNAGMKDELGGKGSGLAEMTNAGVPVPPGFTITTAVCRHYYAHDRKLPPSFEAEQNAALARLEGAIGKRLGDAADPLLVSVRSGAKFSMPGMMDTILNLGLNDRAVHGLSNKTGNVRFAWDCYRRFIQMFASVVMDFEKSEFEHLIEALKKKRRVRLDTELSAADLETLTLDFKRHVRRRAGRDFPQDAREQLAMARDAVFRSWQNDRAIYYRKQNAIPDDIGTAVNVQAMVFGNMGDTSGTGVGFTRNPSTGENHFYGEYLTNAQGEDVVAGVRTPRPIADLEQEMPQVFAQLREITSRLERHYRDVQDFEFTIQEGKLFLLQTRNGKRTAQAAVRIAVDMVREGLISEPEAILRVDPASLDQLLHPRLDPKAKLVVIAHGLAASPGAAVGRAVFDADTAAEQGHAKQRVILVRKETTPDDIHGMDAAQGILTATGGMTSHAAVVARGMGKPCVSGASAIHVNEKTRQMTVDGRIVREGDWLTLDGGTGRVMLGQVPTIDAEVSGEFGEFMAIADRHRRLKVRSNADIPRDAIKAREFGAEGIGLCRTEHMFFAEERLPHVVQMIMAAPAAKALSARLAARERALDGALPGEARALRSEIAAIRKELAGPLKSYRGALAKLLPFQRRDFLGLFKAMRGYPVTIRTLDPPLHEFLPKREDLMVDIATLGRAGAAQKREMAKRYRLTVGQLKKGMPELLRRVEELHEFNPMLGHRGCRLGITYPEITEMQARAIFEAACQVVKEGGDVVPEIMIPLIGTVEELRDQAAIVRRVADETMAARGVELSYLVGTMIEVPRAALTAGRVAQEAEFFSFGTNDLTQMTFGYSRDDAGKFLPEYVERHILPGDPFVSVDQEGVGMLMEWAVKEGRKSRRNLKVGICGEHGGDPASVEFCHRAQLDYVSCSPFRVPLARLAAAQAAVRGAAKDSDRR
ncbi:MAG TPA: pyruvate, phosphate dikinase [Candidatus Acidoferrales bacterium]|nr:pyruvate, phosphate dikinase [Candidatus Acidoferrales bacterium]